MCRLIVGKTALPQRYRPAHFGDKNWSVSNRMYETCMSNSSEQDDFWLTVVVASSFGSVGCVTGSPFDHSGGTDVKWESLGIKFDIDVWDTKHVEVKQPLHLFRVWGGRKSPRAHSITGLPTAVSLTRAEICGNKIFLLLLSFVLFLKGFAAFQTVDIKFTW